MASSAIASAEDFVCTAKRNCGSSLNRPYVRFSVGKQMKILKRCLKILGFWGGMCLFLIGFQYLFDGKIEKGISDLAIPTLVMALLWGGVWNSSMTMESSVRC